MEERANLGLRSGDTVRVWQKIVELKQKKQANKKEVTTKNVRRQAFEGLILAIKHGTEPGGMFTVRRVASGVGVEKIFPLYSPSIESIEVLRRTRTRRAKLYFIRHKAARDAKHAMRKARAYTAPAASAKEFVDAPAQEVAQPETSSEAA